MFIWSFFTVLAISILCLLGWYSLLIYKKKNPPIFPKGWGTAWALLSCSTIAFLYPLATISKRYSTKLEATPEIWETYISQYWSSGFGITSVLVLPAIIAVLFFFFHLLARPTIIAQNEGRLLNMAKSNSIELILLIVVLVLIISKAKFITKKSIIPAKYNVHGWDSRHIGDFLPHPGEN